jgi:predicted DNA-binding transcriptional regulator AlpA
MTPAFLTDIEVAAKLGRSKNWFCDNRARLEREGFPRKDGLIGLTCVADIDAWIARRRQVADAVVAGTHHTGVSANGDDLGNL